MTEEQIKEMLNGIINNGEKWECRAIGERRDDLPIFCYVWHPYKLGDKIYSDWEYRKVEKWYVLQDDRYDNNFLIQNHKGDQIYNPMVFEGTKEECEKWIEEHIKKTWLEEYLKNYFTEHTEYSLSRKGDLLGGIRIGATEVCKKILEEANKIGCKDTVSFIKEIIKDLGV